MLKRWMISPVLDLFLTISQLMYIIHKLTWPLSPGAQPHYGLQWDSHPSYFL